MKWLVWIALASCGRSGFDADPDGGSGGGGGSAVAADAREADATPPCTLGPWSAPDRLAALDTYSNEFAPALSADKLTLLFESDRMGTRDLFEATRSSTGQAFGAGASIVAINTLASERDPTLSMDGLTLYFTSDRTGAPRLYRSTRSSLADAFGAPVEVSELAQVALQDPAVSADGNELFYADAGETTVIRAVHTPDGFIPNGTVTALQGGFASGGPSLSSDGRTLYYHHKADLFSPYELYRAHRASTSAAFGTPAAIAGLDDPSSDDGDPEISKDDRTIVFSSDRQGGAGGYDLYIASRDCQ